LLALAVAAVVVHGAAIAFVYARQGRIDAYAFNSLDCGEYYTIASNLVEHGTFSQSESPPLLPDTWRTPGYPLLLAGVMLVPGNSPAALILVQHLLAILSVLLVFQIASRRLRPPAAFAVGLICLLEPYHLFYSFWLLNAIFFTFVLLVTWLSWERARERGKLWHYSVLGLFSGFLVLIWPGAILIPVLLLSLAGWNLYANRVATTLEHQITSSPSTLLTLSVLTAATIIPPAGWMFRNQFVAGHFALSHQSGIVLAYFKATEVELWHQGRTGERYVETSLNPDSRNKPHLVWDDIDRKLCLWMGADKGGTRCDDLRWYNLAQGNRTSRDSFVISNALARIGTSMLLQQPLAAVSCGLTRIGENLVFPLGLAVFPARDAPVNRLKAAAFGVAYAGLILAAFVGAIRARRDWQAISFPIVCTISLAVTTTPQIDPRFRVPMIPLLAFLALIPFRRAES